MLKSFSFNFHSIRSLVNILLHNTHREKIKDNLTICMERAVEKSIKLSWQLPRKQFFETACIFSVVKL